MDNFQITTPTIEIDGHIYRRSDITIPVVAVLYLVRKAKAGDTDALELLNLCEVVITDAKGERYWPAKEAS